MDSTRYPIAHNILCVIKDCHITQNRHHPVTLHLSVIVVRLDVLARLPPMSTTTYYDIIIIGTGPGGGTLAYRLAQYRNGLSPVIPERIITRPPSAELRANQTDQDSLPPYEILDAIVEAFMEENRSPREVIAMGYQPEDVLRVTRLVKLNEYKRRQSPVGVRITERGFGKDWRYPITSKYLPET